jgi:D-glycero-D-manno-heptose 1,7-bisphosphate phosphatase
MRTLLIDRDGVINHDRPDFVRDPDDWLPVPGSLAAIARAQRAGFRIIVISNQSGIGRGLLDIAALNAIHARLIGALASHGARVDAFFFCPHAPEDGCACRKPRAGLLLAVKERLGLDLGDVAFIGDRRSDADAALAAGARPVLVRSGPEALDPAALAAAAIPVYADLAAAVDGLL